MAKEKNVNLMDIVDQAFTEGFINDHCSYSSEFEHVTHLGILSIPVRGKMYVCPLYEMCCLNPLYVDSTDGSVHLSTWSVGGNFIARGKGYEAATQEYNENYKYDNEFICVQTESLILISKEAWERKRQRLAELRKG